jgi:isoaspartyl peptidase/L-asparaginase-like protein (Ntn-hydrolase superfamily)
VLASGGTAMEAVEAAVRLMEENPVFDCGRGSVLNSAGEVRVTRGGDCCCGLMMSGGARGG